jgi:plastocyanin
MQTRFISICASLLLLVGLVVLAQERSQVASAGSAAFQVKVDNFSFTPATITVPAGTTVTWENRDDIPHTVVSDEKVFRSKALDTDDTFSYTFTQRGTYPYFCGLHPKMTGTIVVQ